MLRVGTQMVQIWLTLVYYFVIMALQFLVTGMHGHLNQALLVPLVIMLSGYDYQMSRHVTADKYGVKAAELCTLSLLKNFLLLTLIQAMAVSADTYISYIAINLMLQIVTAFVISITICYNANKVILWL